MYREDKHHHNAIDVRQGNGHIHCTPCRCIGCRESKKKNAHKKNIFTEHQNYREKQKTNGRNENREEKKNNVIEHLCVDLLQSHKHLSQAISHNKFDFDAVQKSALLLSNLLHFFCSILNSVHFILVFFSDPANIFSVEIEESLRCDQEWIEESLRYFGAITNESNVCHGDRQSILYHFMSKIDQAAISSVFDQQISECYLLGRKRSNKIIGKPSKNEYFIFTSIESAYTIWCAAWSSEKTKVNLCES